MSDLFSLARNNRYDSLKELALNGELSVDVRDAKGNTLLLVACQNGLKRIAKLLIRCGADINAQNDAGNTALHFAHMYGFSDSLGAFLLEQGANPEIRNFQKGLLPHEVGSNTGFLPSIRGASRVLCGENPPSSDAWHEHETDDKFSQRDGHSDSSWFAHTADVDEYAYDDVAETNSNWVAEDVLEWKDQTEKAEDSKIIKHPSAPRGILRLATTERAPPRRHVPSLSPTSPTILVRKTPSGVRRPPPNLPHPDDLAAAEDIVAKEAGRKHTVAVTPKKKFDAVGDPEASGALVGTSATPKTPLLEISLMEAMISSDYVAMGRALQVAQESEVHAALLNACARRNEKAVNILLDRAPEISLLQGCVICARGGNIGPLRLLVDASNDSHACVNAAIIQGASRGHSVLVSELIERRQASPGVVRRCMLSAAVKNMPEVVKALLPQSVYEDRRASLLSCISGGIMPPALVLIGAIPARFMDQPLAVCATKGNAVLVRHILAIRDSAEFDIEALSHAVNVAEAKGHTSVAAMLRDHIKKSNQAIKPTQSRK